MPYPTFREHTRAAFGERWVIWHNRKPTDRLKRKYGEDVRCVTGKEYDKLRDAWIDGHPAIGLALTLPDCDSRALILRAVRRELS